MAKSWLNYSYFDIYAMPFSLFPTSRGKYQGSFQGFILT